MPDTLPTLKAARWLLDLERSSLDARIAEVDRLIHEAENAELHWRMSPEGRAATREGAIDEIAALLPPHTDDEPCHCGNPVYYEPAIPGPDPRGFTRGLCADCDAERCDAPEADAQYTCHTRRFSDLAAKAQAAWSPDVQRVHDAAAKVFSRGLTYRAPKDHDDD